MWNFQLLLCWKFTVPVKELWTRSLLLWQVFSGLLFLSHPERLIDPVIDWLIDWLTRLATHLDRRNLREDKQRWEARHPSPLSLVYLHATGFSTRRTFHQSDLYKEQDTSTFNGRNYSNDQTALVFSLPYADFPVTSATSPRQTRDIPFSPNSITPTSPKLPRPWKFRGSRRNGIWALSWPHVSWVVCRSLQKHFCHFFCPFFFFSA